MSKIFLIDDPDNRIIAGADSDGVFTVKFSVTFPEWKFRLMDFLQYEELFSRKVIRCYSDENEEIAAKAYAGHSITDRELRFYEKQILVHSTPRMNWENIQKSGLLKSWNLAKQDGDINEAYPIGKELGDFEEYSDYVMLGNMGFWNEIVVASKQKGSLCYDKDQAYQPGARIYLDAARIAHGGLLVRDGLHLKVKDSLPLSQYMIWCALPEDFCQHEVWTPAKYSQTADALFLSEYGETYNFHD